LDAGTHSAIEFYGFHAVEVSFNQEREHFPAQAAHALTRAFFIAVHSVALAEE
jgi:hypothetical protein